MRLPKQTTISWLGPMVDSLYTSLPILSIFNFLSIQTVLYTTVMQYVLPWLPWLNFGWFIFIMVVITFGVMFLVYKFVIPSLWVWRGKQLYGHESQLMDKVEELKNGIMLLKEEHEKQMESLKKSHGRQLKTLKREIKELRESFEGQSV